MSILSLTQNQSQAIAARGNVLVIAGAGTGKTRTLVERCLTLIRQGVRMDRLLLVTFTEAAAAEMRQRIRQALLSAIAQSPSTHLSEQLALLDSAYISTLHSFCAFILREHFYALGLDPQFAILDPRQAQPLLRESLDLLMRQACRSASGPPANGPAPGQVQKLIRRRGRGSDAPIRYWIVALHRFAQSLPNPSGWLSAQIDFFQEPQPSQWHCAFRQALNLWRKKWASLLGQSSCLNIQTCCAALQQLESNPRSVFDQIQSADDSPWPPRQKTKLRAQFTRFFDEAIFLRSLCPDPSGKEPIAEDWSAVREEMATLLQLTQQFTADFARAKQERGGLDFADLEQFTLRLLIDPATSQPTPIAQSWQDKLDFIFVDEYQDINAAQDAIITALSRPSPTANRFLVGDVKQSIYRFRLSNPHIFQQYAADWTASSSLGCALSLNENFRSREAILQFVNAFFGCLMQAPAGGIDYSPDLHLQFGDPLGRSALACSAAPPDQSHPHNASFPRVELSVILPDNPAAAGEANSPDDAENPHDSSPPNSETDLADLQSAEREARGIAARLRTLKEQQHLIWDHALKQFRPVEWRDMAVLLRSPGNKVEAYAKEFDRCGIPLNAPRGGFFHCLEVSDLLQLLRLLDNPLQDVPLLAVLRSPLAGFDLEELARIRLADRSSLFWTALRRFQELHRPSPANPLSTNESALWHKTDSFLTALERWRTLSRVQSLSHCLETVLSETAYEAFLAAEPRGPHRVANVRKLLDLIRQYDPYQRQGLYRFLRFVDILEDEQIEEEPAPVPTENAVQLMSIHKSKGLEFPVVVVADLGKHFNFSGLQQDLIIDTDHRICPLIVAPTGHTRYPSITYWLAQRRERSEIIGEEMRLLYVAFTRARDTLILSGVGSAKPLQPADPPPTEISPEQIVAARSAWDWIALWLQTSQSANGWSDRPEGQNALFRWTFYNLDHPIFTKHPKPVPGNPGHLPASPQPAHALPLPSSDNLSPAASLSSLATSNRSAADALHSPLPDQLDWSYPFLPASREPAKTSVSVLRQRAEPSNEARRFPPAPPVATDLSHAKIGIAHHQFLQLVDLDKTSTVSDLQAEAQRLQNAGLLEPGSCQTLDLPSIANFWSSSTGRELLKKRGHLHREIPFTARFGLIELAELGLPTQAGESPLLADEFVVVQGVIDLAALMPNEIWILDFKTDRLHPADDLAPKAALYAPQLKLYSAALSRIYQRPVTQRWLHFLSIGRTLSL